MQAVLVGGPLHGIMLQLDGDPALQSLSQSVNGRELVYLRRGTYDNAGSVGGEIAIFVHGEPGYAEVADAIGQSDLMANTGKIRALGADFALWLSEDSLKAK